MKRKKVMRLLAVAMAASLAVTSVPGTTLMGTEIVYANSAEPTINSEGLTNGHLYQEVSRVEHTHTADCYNGAVEATASTNYFTSVADAEAYGKVSGTEGTDKVSITSGETTYYKKVSSGFWTLTEESSCPVYTIPEGKYIAEDSAGSTYSLYDGVGDDTTHEIEVARNNTSDKKANERIAYLKDTDLTAIKGTYADTPDSSSGTTNLAAAGTSTISTDYYTITKYAKADLTKNENAAKIPGAIVVTQAVLDDTTAYSSEAGFSGAKLNEVYIPLVVTQATITPAAAGTTQEVGSVTYTAVSNGQGSIVWINKAVKSSTQPETCYTISSDHTKFILRTATAAVHKDDVAAYTYSYDKASVVSGNVTTEPTAIGSNETIYSVTTGEGDEAVTKYYKDVSKEFVTGIKVTNASSDQYVTKDSKESDLNDEVTLTLGVDGSTTTEKVSEKNVTSKFNASATYAGSGDDVTIESITTNTIYAAIDSSKANIITKDDIRAVSTIRDFSASALTALGLTGSGSYKVTTVTAPTISLTTSNITATTVAGREDDGNTVYYYKQTEAAYPSIAKPEITNDSDWKFQWVDDVIDDHGEATNKSSDTASTYSELDQKYDVSEVGHHQVYIKATYSTTDTTVTSDKLDFYVLKDNPTTIEYSANQTYNNGSEIEAPTENGAPDPNAKVDYSYFVTATGSIDATTAGLPTVPGSYTVVATYEEDLVKGLKKTQKTANVTVDKAADTASTDAIPVAKSKTTEGTQTVKLNSILSKYTTGGEFSVGEAGLVSQDTTNIKSENIAFNGTKNELTFTLESTAEVEKSEIVATLTNTNYTVTVTVTIDIKAAGTVIKDLSDLPAIVIYYNDYPDTDNDGWDALLKENIYKDESEKSNYKIGFGSTDGTTKPTAVGTTKVYVTYTKTDDETTTYGSGSTTLEIKKKPLTINATAQTINVGGNFADYAFTVTQGAGKEVTTLPDGLKATTKITDSGNNEVSTGIDTEKAGTYTLTYTIADDDGYDVLKNYDINVNPATLTVQGTTVNQPTGDKDKDTSDTTEPTIKENEDGTKTIVDADGKVIANDKVTIDGKSYITGNDGEILTSQIAETPSGNKVYVGKDGVIVKNKTVTTEDGKKYYATKHGKIATNGFVTTAKGNKVYATVTGALKVSKTFTVNGKKYYAKASGAIATTGFVKTASGNTVYATKTGALKVNKAFKAADGKKYVADKNGKIVKGKKITIGNKTYTTNKKGVIVKVTTKKK